MTAVRLVFALALGGACVEPPAPTCEERVCAHVPACSPATTGGWDFRTEAACLASFECGATPRACLAAVRDLPCLSDPPTWPELEASTRAFVRVREACGVSP